MNTLNSWRACSARGLPRTIAAVIPCTAVASYGIRSPGSTRVTKRSVSRPSTNLTAATSTMRAPRCNPVVSVSKKTNCRSGSVATVDFRSGVEPEFLPCDVEAPWDIGQF